MSGVWQQAISNREEINTALCGEGFRDTRNVINCRGCGLKFQSGAEFGEHGKEMQRRRVRQERSEQVVNKNKRLGNGDSRRRRGSVDGGKMGVVEHIAERSMMTETSARPATQQVSMPGTANTAYPGHAHHILPPDYAQHPSLMTSVPQQLLQQQLHQQQLAFQQQQQLMILKQQQQSAPFPVMQQQIPQQQFVSDRDRQIALLEQELKVQKMMMEVERREAIVREQARLLTVQVDRMRMEQDKVIRPHEVPSTGVPSTIQEQAWTEHGAAGGHHEALNGREADGVVEVNEKIKLERMLNQMEKARKEELDKAVLDKVTKTCDETGLRLEKPDQKIVNGVKYNKVEVKCPDGTYSDLIVRKKAFKNNITVKHIVNGVSPENDQSSSTKRQEERSPKLEPSMVADDMFSLNDEAAKEQLKIMEEIKARNEEKRKHEEMTIKLITKLSLDEGEQLLSDSCDGATVRNDSWPDLKEAATAGVETVRQKIARLKETAEKRGMCVDKNNRQDRCGSGKDSGVSMEDSVIISSPLTYSAENDKLMRKMMKNNEKLKRERTKSEAMSELEKERKKAADELKERLAAQERELFSRMVATEGKQGDHGVYKKRNKAGK